MMWTVPQPHEIVTEFMVYTTRPRQDQLSALAAKHIPLWALAGAPGSGEFGVGFCRVVRDGLKFEFGDDGTPAMAVIARNGFGDPADIVAWSLKRDWIAAWLGRVSMLGMPDAFAARMEEVLTVHPDPMSWLQNERNGIVLIDPVRAARELRDAGPFMAAGGGEHAERLAVQLEPPRPIILVPVHEGEKRAA